MWGEANGAPHFFFFYRHSQGCSFLMVVVHGWKESAWLNTWPLPVRGLCRASPPRRAFSSYNKLWAQVASPQKHTPPISSKKCMSAISPPSMYRQSRLAEYDENRRVSPAKGLKLILKRCFLWILNQTIICACSFVFFRSFIHNICCDNLFKVSYTKDLGMEWKWNRNGI